MLLFSDDVELFVPPEKGRRHALRIIRDLYAHESRSRGTSLSAAFTHLLHVMRRRSVVLVISDFMDSGFEKPMKALARKHDTVIVQLIDPREEAVPAVGLMELTDAETGETIVVDTSSSRVRQWISDRAFERTAELDELFRRNRVDRVAIHTDQSYLEPLVEFFRRRTRSR